MSVAAAALCHAHLCCCQRLAQVLAAVGDAVAVRKGGLVDEAQVALRDPALGGVDAEETAAAAALSGVQCLQKCGLHWPAIVLSLLMLRASRIHFLWTTRQKSGKARPHTHTTCSSTTHPSAIPACKLCCMPPAAATATHPLPVGQAGLPRLRQLPPLLLACEAVQLPQQAPEEARHPLARQRQLPLPTRECHVRVAVSRGQLLRGGQRLDSGRRRKGKAQPGGSGHMSAIIHVHLLRLCQAGSALKAKHRALCTALCTQATAVKSLS